MRRYPTSEKTYLKAIYLIETTLNVKIRKVGLFNIRKTEVQNFFKVNTKFLEVFKGFYLYKNNKIFIIDGNEEDLQTFIHETLHSNSIFHGNNSPIWIHEGLTKAITEYIMTKNHIDIQIDYYSKKEREFWLEKILNYKEQIFNAFFSNN